MPNGEFKVVQVQPDAEVDTFSDQLLITLRSDWSVTQWASIELDRLGKLLSPALLYVDAEHTHVGWATLPAPCWQPQPSLS